jgi:hypothetical protein
MLSSKGETESHDHMNNFLLPVRWMGRFGNRMFQYAYGATYARLTGRQYYLPSEWEGTRLFRSQPHRVVDNPEIRAALADPDESYESDQARLAVIRRCYPDAELFDADRAEDPYASPGHPRCFANVCAYNPAIIAELSRRHLQQLCEFSEEVTSLRSYRRYSDMQGLYDVAHLRRDDISDAAYNRTHVQGYSVISMDAYYRAFEMFGYSPDAIEWVSDDYAGKWHVGRKRRYPGTWTYPTGSQYVPGLVFDWLDDFLKLYFARTIFRANSSFSWWAGALSPTAKVFSPVLDKRHIYGVDGTQEIVVDFVEGNQPHWAMGGAYPKPALAIGP